MKVPYDEDLANHVSPESCGGCGNTSAFGLVLLTGESVGGENRDSALKGENGLTWGRVR